MKLKDFDYYLLEELIAQEPVMPRDSSRLLVLDRKKGEIRHRKFFQIVDLLQEGDVVVLNNTRVIPARLRGRKKDTGGKAEVFLLKREEADIWECLLRPARRIKKGCQICFPQKDLQAKVLKRGRGSTGIVKFSSSGEIEEAIARAGQLPLPPYIKREGGPTLRDEQRYQTVYAREKGAVAAPTAGLHFTSSLLQAIKDKGVEVVEITLHTGWASFKPLFEEKVEENKIPEEYFRIDEEAALAIDQVRKKGGRVLAVGTTTTRALEAGADPSGLVEQKEGWTDLFIYPGYRFRVVEILLTNFHLPRSSPLLLVAGFAGREKLLTAYEEALKKRYRFLSFGDAMLVI